MAGETDDGAIFGRMNEIAVRRPAHHLLAAPQVPKWQPIETAPKDGTEILLWVPGGFVWHAVMAFSNGMWADRYTGRPLPFLKVPTHWMPLPKPPEDK